MKRIPSGGGWPAVRYAWRKSQEVGGLLRMWKALRTKNTCKTCALGMGGQKGGMVNEIGGFPEVCKKSLQAMAADMQGAIQPEFWSTYSIDSGICHPGNSSRVVGWFSRCFIGTDKNTISP